MTEKIKRVLTPRRLWIIGIANLIALLLLLTGNLTPQQWFDYSVTVLRLIILGV